MRMTLLILAVFLIFLVAFIDRGLVGQSPPGVIVGTDGPDIVTASPDGQIILNGLITSENCVWREITVYAGNGDDLVDLSNCQMKVTVVGGEGNDYIRGGIGDDFLIGGSGDDTIYGNKGADIIKGEDGNDGLNGEEHADQIYGGDGDDTIKGNDGDDFIYGNSGNDILEGNDGDDFIYGNEGSDQIYGGDGNDYIRGGSGPDVILGDDGRDFMCGDEDSDIISDKDGNHNKAGGGDGVDTIIVDVQTSGLVTGEKPTSAENADPNDFVTCDNRNRCFIDYSTVTGEGVCEPGPNIEAFLD